MELFHIYNIKCVECVLSQESAISLSRDVAICNDDILAFTSLF